MQLEYFILFSGICSNNFLYENVSYILFKVVLTLLYCFAHRKLTRSMSLCTEQTCLKNYPIKTNWKKWSHP